MTTVVTAVKDVFTAVSTWITGAIVDLIPVFYVPETGLTFLGVLAVCGLSISIVFLLIGLISNFLRFRS